MKMKNKIATIIRKTLTVISPKLNTYFLYRVKFKKRLDLNNVVTLNEKILWLKFNTYWNNDLIKQCADKYRVREYIEGIGLSHILNNLIASYEKVEDIDWKSLPPDYALKLNIGCGKNIIVKDNNIDIPNTIEKLQKWLKEDYWKEYSEMQYKDVKPYFIFEEYLGSDEGDLPKDYKFYCMNGKSKYVMVCEDREIGKKAKYFYFDRDWNMMPYTQDALDNPSIVIPKPDMIDEAFDIAEKLSQDFPFVRVDLYIVNKKVYFGELTFTPSAGLDNGRLPTTDKLLGEQLNLSNL